MKTPFSRFILTLLVLTVALATNAPAQSNSEQRVFEYVIKPASNSVSEVAAIIARSASEEGYIVLSSLSAGVPDECSFSSTVVALYDPTYTGQIIDLNPLTAPYAVIDRINVFEDERGIFVTIVNANSILRTVMLDDPAHLPLADEHDARIRSLIETSTPGENLSEQFGQKRKKGHIGKTMGVMAGGPFNRKLKTIATVPDSNWEEIASIIETAFSDPGPKWNTRAAYTALIQSGQLAIIGISGTELERKSFSIVKAGSDKTRKKLQCPGIAHAASYPLELVVRQHGYDVCIEMVDAMFRMKMTRMVPDQSFDVFSRLRSMSTPLSG